MSLSRLKNDIEETAAKIAIYYHRIGLRGLVSLFAGLGGYAVLSSLGFKMRGRPHYCFVKGCAHPVMLRYGTSDLSVFKQIFIEQEYLPLEAAGDLKCIIDCGAYVGYSSVYFLSRYQNARVTAVEPCAANFDILRKNLAPYGKRVTLLHSAVYPYQTGLVVYGGNYIDGREWTIQVRPAKDGERPDVVSVDMDTLIKRSGCDPVDLVKIDIERAEIDLFSGDCKEWLDKVRNIAIELHDKECSDIFFKALSGHDHNLSVSGELTICMNISPKEGNT